MLTQKRLKELLSYDLNTGLFTWRTNGKDCRIKVGDVAGSRDSHSKHWRITVDGAPYESAHLVWLYLFGRFPKPGYEMKHLNNLKADNSLNNLKEVIRHTCRDEYGWSTKDNMSEEEL